MGSTASLERPTRVRYGVLTLLCALAFVLYLDRICISQAAEFIQEELGLDNTQMGYVFGAFILAYGLFEVPTGRWGDRYGSRKVLLRIVLWWSVFTALTGCVWRFSLDSGWRIPVWSDWSIPVLFDSLMLLILIRFLFGVGEAGALPNTARVIARWFPADRRGPAQGLINTAMLVGGASAPVAAANLIKLIGWRLTFSFFASLGVVWMVIFQHMFRDHPSDHPQVNEAERRLIEAGIAPDHDPKTHPPIPWSLVLGSANVWLLGSIMTCTASVTYFFFSWYPKYLHAGRGVGEAESGWLASLVLLGGAVGSTAGGFICDALVRWTSERPWTLRLVGVFALLLGAGAMWSSVACTSALLASALAGLTCLMILVEVTAWWAVVTAISGKHLGALFGLMNSMGIFGALLSPVLLGRYVDWRQELGYVGRDQWDPAFTVYALILLVGALAWLFVDAGRSAVNTPAPGVRGRGEEEIAPC